MSALERYVKDAARVAGVKKVRALIDTLGIEYIYYQFVSVTGRIMGKGAPADHWERLANKGFQLVYGSTANLFISRSGRYLGYGPEASELVGLAEPDTFVQLPWEPRVARVFCTLFRNREEAKDAGEFLSADCRGNLARAHAAFERKHRLSLRLGTEPEMMWLKKGADGKPDGGVTKPFFYHIDQFEELRPITLRVTEYCRKMGIDSIQGDHEDAPGQIELNWTYDTVERTADRLTTYRQICAQVAREFNVIACFMTKPFMKLSANGCHHNFSLWKGGQAQVNRFGGLADHGMPGVFSYVSGGQNKFEPEGKDIRMPGPIGQWAAGGILKHLPALTALGASTVNSYRRLLDLGYWAPVYNNWGYQNRTCALRVSAPGRFEYRAVDSMVNPYLLNSALLAAMDEGLSKKMAPGPLEQRNIYELELAGKKVVKLPMNLGAALDAIEADAVIRAALPGEMWDVFIDYKRDEWDRFLATVTAWDHETYMDCLP
jgi:glutamine synthetase